MSSPATAFDVGEKNEATRTSSGKGTVTPSVGSNNDVGKEEEQVQPELQRKLKARHLQMIAIGGTIGTGLFIGSGGALAKAGPAGALIAYLFVGSIVYSVMVSLGEMANISSPPQTKPQISPSPSQTFMPY